MMRTCSDKSKNIAIFFQAMVAVWDVHGSQAWEMLVNQQYMVAKDAETSELFKTAF